MPTHKRTPPPLDTLVRFLRRRHALPAAEIAGLLDVPRTTLISYATSEEALREDGTVQWKDAARWLVEAWPADTLMSRLGPAADLLPAGFQPSAFVLRPPAYVIHALRVQWQTAAMPQHIAPRESLEDYLVDLLHDAIEPATIDLLRHDEEFMRAYEFPDREPGGEETG
jgi:hypothetical protein